MVGPSRGGHAVCAICGEQHKKLPKTWVWNDCSTYCGRCWGTVRCSTCDHHDPKGHIVHGRWTCRACRHRHKVRGAAGGGHESLHQKIIEDRNGEPWAGAVVNDTIPSRVDISENAMSAPSAVDDDEGEDEDQLAPLRKMAPGVKAGPDRPEKTNHIVLLLDASGSMRTKDVACEDPGDRESGAAMTRLEAVVARASCFVQAHARDHPVDVFSVAAFSETAEVVCQLADAAGAQRGLQGLPPRGAKGTLYGAALAAAAGLLALRPGVPGHALLLSDGRPADPKEAVRLLQELFLRGEHAGTRVHGIGFGAEVQSFAPLQQLACLSGGAFALAECSVRSLRDAFCSVSSTMTSVDCRSGTRAGPGPSRHTPRPVRFEPPELGAFGKRGVLRLRAGRAIFRYDGVAFHEQRWPAANVKRRTLPCMRGGMRLVHAFHDPLVVPDDGSWMVAKSSLYLDDALNTRGVVESHAKSTAVASHFAARFNEQIRAGTAADPAGAPAGKTALYFVPCFVYEVEGEPPGEGEPRFFAGERYLPGVFMKYNSNNGFVSESAMRHHERVQAFTHFTFAASGGALLVADLQGVAREAEVLLTDPQVLSLAGGFGPGDLRARGVRACLAAHRCGPTCRRLGLQPVSSALLRRLDPPSRARPPPGAKPLSSSSGMSGSWEKVSRQSGTSAEWDAVSEHGIEEYALSDGIRSSQASTSSWVDLSGA